MVTCEGLVTALPDSFRSYLKNKVFGFCCREHSQPERLAQVHLTDLGVGKDFFRTPGCNDRALIDDVGPGADPEGLAHIMVSDQDPDAAMRQLADDALDIQHGQRIIRELTHRGIGVLITDHNVRETLGVCARAYIVNQGTVIASGSAEEVLANPQVREVYLGESFRL